jgi:hypothetical protein
MSCTLAHFGIFGHILAHLCDPPSALDGLRHRAGKIAQIALGSFCIFAIPMNVDEYPRHLPLPGSPGRGASDAWSQRSADSPNRSSSRTHLDSTRTKPLSPALCPEYREEELGARNSHASIPCRALRVCAFGRATRFPNTAPGVRETAKKIRRRRIFHPPRAARPEAQARNSSLTCGRAIGRCESFAASIESAVPEMAGVGPGLDRRLMYGE